LFAEEREQTDSQRMCDSTDPTRIADILDERAVRIAPSVRSLFCHAPIRAALTNSRAIIPGVSTRFNPCKPASSRMAARIRRTPIGISIDDPRELLHRMNPQIYCVINPDLHVPTVSIFW